MSAPHARRTPATAADGRCPSCSGRVPARAPWCPQCFSPLGTGEEPELARGEGDPVGGDPVGGDPTGAPGTGAGGSPAPGPPSPEALAEALRRAEMLTAELAATTSSPYPGLLRAAVATSGGRSLVMVVGALALALLGLAALAGLGALLG